MCGHLQLQVTLDLPVEQAPTEKKYLVVLLAFEAEHF